MVDQNFGHFYVPKRSSSGNSSAFKFVFKFVFFKGDQFTQKFVG